jgi:hydroxyacyl-ACP dehydratase HTD2-like protein with hotdog domain
MTDQVYYEDVSVGDQITPARLGVSRAQMFLFGAATNNAHRIHYDYKWATEREGYPDILVHGPLQAALMARALTDWGGPRSRLARIDLQNRAFAVPDEELVFTGVVTGKRIEDGEAVVDVAFREERDNGELLMPGSATVALPRRGVTA